MVSDLTWWWRGQWRERQHSRVGNREQCQRLSYDSSSVLSEGHYLGKGLVLTPPPAQTLFSVSVQITSFSSKLLHAKREIWRSLTLAFYIIITDTVMPLPALLLWLSVHTFPKVFSLNYYRSSYSWENERTNKKEKWNMKGYLNLVCMFCVVLYGLVTCVH